MPSNELAHFLFQSTPSGGKATGGVGQLDIRLGVSIHAFRGEGDLAQYETDAATLSVSIHAFRGEGDLLAVLIRIDQ